MWPFQLDSMQLPLSIQVSQGRRTEDPFEDSLQVYIVPIVEYAAGLFLLDIKKVLIYILRGQGIPQDRKTS